MPLETVKFHKLDKEPQEDSFYFEVSTNLFLIQLITSITDKI